MTSGLHCYQTWHSRNPCHSPFRRINDTWSCRQCRQPHALLPPTYSHSLGCRMSRNHKNRLLRCSLRRSCMPKRPYSRSPRTRRTRHHRPHLPSSCHHSHSLTLRRYNPLHPWYQHCSYTLLRPNILRFQIRRKRHLHRYPPSSCHRNRTPHQHRHMPLNPSRLKDRHSCKHLG